jgi:hypothetical protein
MNSAGMFRKEIGYIKDIFVHIYKGRKNMLDGSLPGLTERLSSEGLYIVSASAYGTHYAVYEIFVDINSSEIASKFDKKERKFGEKEGKFDEVERKFDKVEYYFDKKEGKLGEKERKFGEVERKFDKVEYYFDEKERKLGEKERKFGEVERKFDKVEYYFDEKERKFSEKERKFDEGEGKFGKGVRYFLAMGGSEKRGEDNESFWNKRNRQKGEYALRFCYPFKKSVTYTKIIIKQCMIKIKCLWERLENKINNHLKWVPVSGTGKKSEQLIKFLLNIKKGVYHDEYGCIAT